DARTQLQAITTRLAELDRLTEGADRPAALLTEEEQRAGLASLDLDRQRALVDALMTVYLRRAPRGRKGFDKSTVRVAWR
ncbi:hypothetical protein QT666_22560, partial [Xanthomonas citri pv. citri]